MLICKKYALCVDRLLNKGHNACKDLSYDNESIDENPESKDFITIIFLNHLIIFDRFSFMK